MFLQGKMPIPTYEVADAPKGSPGPQRLVIERSTAAIRPHCVAATLRGVTLDQTAYDSFIDLQGSNKKAVITSTKCKEF